MSTTAATAAGKRRARARSGRSKPSTAKRVRRRPSRAARRKAPAHSNWTRRLSLASWRGRLILVAIVAGALAITYFAWFRHSSFVAVEHVKVEGVSTPDRDRITAALTDSAEGMTTLDVDTNRLASAVSGFPNVASVTADPSFPHGLTVHVTERAPVLVVSEGHHRRTPVAADGSLLPGVEVDGSTLPVLRVDDAPASGRLQGEALDEARVMGTAPPSLRPLVEGAATSRDYGIVVTLHPGIDLRFGPASRPEAKWAAAAAVLADPKVTSLEYVDVRVPSRPAIGG